MIPNHHPDGVPSLSIFTTPPLFERRRFQFHEIPHTVPVEFKEDPVVAGESNSHTYTIQIVIAQSIYAKWKCLILNMIGLWNANRDTQEDCNLQQWTLAMRLSCMCLVRFSFLIQSLGCTGTQALAENGSIRLVDEGVTAGRISASGLVSSHKTDGRWYLRHLKARYLIRAIRLFFSSWTRGPSTRSGFKACGCYETRSCDERWNVVVVVVACCLMSSRCEIV